MDAAVAVRFCSAVVSVAMLLSLLLLLFFFVLLSRAGMICSSSLVLFSLSVVPSKKGGNGPGPVAVPVLLTSGRRRPDERSVLLDPICPATGRGGMVARE